ncbi:MAG: zinc metallopeptidase [Planctomycetes bacterium]|nr:zinc metallopeptidase [Planctomycetota bacterium]
MYWTMFDPMWYVIVGPFILLALLAQLKVKTAFSRWSREPNRRGVSGAEAAAVVLRAAGVGDVAIQEHHGFLSDHYDPREKVLRLSAQVFRGRSIASIGVAAHEAGHALQHAQGYAPLAIRSAIVPMASIGSSLSLPLIFLGLLFPMGGSFWLLKLGIACFSGVVFFQLVTLPVEFNASSRAKRILAETGLAATAEEVEGVSSVLSAAALTYVAATLQAIATLVYYLLLAGRRRG